MFIANIILLWESPVAKVIKNLPTMQEIWETWVWSLDGKDPLEEEMTTHSLSILAWGIPWTEEPDRLRSMGSQRVGHDWATEHTCTHTHTNCIIVCEYPCIDIPYQELGIITLVLQMEKLRYQNLNYIPKIVRLLCGRKCSSASPTWKTLTKVPKT